MKGFRGDTTILTPSGNVRLNTLADNDWIYTLDPETLEVSIARCTAPVIIGRSSMWRLQTQNKLLLCVPETLFFTFDKGLVAAGDLIAGDRLSGLYLSTDDAQGKMTTVLGVKSPDPEYTGAITDAFFRADEVITNSRVSNKAEDIWNIDVKGNNVLFIHNFAVAL